MISTLNETLDSADLNSERSFEISWCKFETKLWIQQRGGRPGVLRRDEWADVVQQG